MVQGNNFSHPDLNKLYDAGITALSSGKAGVVCFQSGLHQANTETHQCFESHNISVQNLAIKVS